MNRHGCIDLASSNDCHHSYRGQEKSLINLYISPISEEKYQASDRLKNNDILDLSIHSNM